MKKVMIVTGASRGIGASVARLAARSGFKVCVNYLHSEQTADDVVAGIRNDGGDAIAVQADVGSEQEVARLFEEVDNRLGVLDVLVNNAGILAQRRVEKMDAAELTRIFRVNVFSAFYCSREAIQRMSASHGGKGGVVINMSSAASRLGGLAGGSHYAATKGAIDSFSLALAKEVGREKIRVNAVRPGLIETDIHAVHGGINTALVEAVPLGRSGSADEVAEVVLWLASDAASYVHGAVVDVSGGR